MVAPNEGDVYVWYRSTGSLDGDAVTSFDKHLSLEERARRDRFYFGPDRRDFTIAHDLLRRALSKHGDVRPSDWRFDVNNYGKPSIESLDPQTRALSFSLSHTRGSAACAITSNALLGIDVERIDRSQLAQEIADRFFSKEEATWLSRYSGDLRNIRFTELWTLKEAFIKAIGVGLAVSPSVISFQFEEPACIGFSMPFTFHPHQWHFALFEPSRDVRLGIAIQSATKAHFMMRLDEGDERLLAPIRESAHQPISGSGKSRDAASDGPLRTSPQYLDCLFRTGAMSIVSVSLAFRRTAASIMRPRTFGS
jgi:4'-phosphopantetheinyl transferase